MHIPIARGGQSQGKVYYTNKNYQVFLYILEVTNYNSSCGLKGKQA